jgi:hypothetical protein
LESTQNQNSRRGRVVWTGLIFVCLLLIAAAIWKSGRSAASMSNAAGSNEEQFTQPTVGSKIKVVLEVHDIMADGTIRGTLLQKKTEEIYSRTPINVTAHVMDRTALAMGKWEELRPNATIHMTGMVRESRSIDAEQIVILRDYVHVE